MERMQAAAKHFLGTHDFTSFRGDAKIICLGLGLGTGSGFRGDDRVVLKFEADDEMHQLLLLIPPRS